MPLEHAGVGTPGFSRNVETEVNAGKPVKQAVAIAYSKARGDAEVRLPKISEQRDGRCLVYDMFGTKVGAYFSRQKAEDHLSLLVKKYNEQKDSISMDSLLAKADALFQRADAATLDAASGKGVLLNRSGKWMIQGPDGYVHGPYYSEQEAREMAKKTGITLDADGEDRAADAGGPNDWTGLLITRDLKAAKSEIEARIRAGKPKKNDEQNLRDIDRALKFRNDTDDCAMDADGLTPSEAEWFGKQIAAALIESKGTPLPPQAVEALKKAAKGK